MVFWKRFHICETPNLDTFAPIAGRRWACPECGDEWVYETREIEVENSPGVWDRWPDTEKVPVTAWYKVKEV